MLSIDEAARHLMGGCRGAGARSAPSSRLPSNGSSTALYSGVNMLRTLRDTKFRGTRFGDTNRPRGTLKGCEVTPTLTP